MFELFERAVQTNCDASAIILSNNEALSYRNVLDIVIRWSKYFIYLGVHQGDRVAVVSAYEDIHPFIHLALDLINATVVPLDTEIPPAQLALDLHYLDLKKIIIDETLCQHNAILESLRIDTPKSGILPECGIDLDSINIPVIERDSTIPNYIVASSGVTDNKKWIPICSAGLHYWAEIEKTLLPLSAKDKVLCTRSPAYDARISEYVRAFAAGGTLVLLTQSQRRDFDFLIEACEKTQITCMILIASQLAIAHLEEVIERLSRSGLTHLMVTGDACSLKLKQVCEQSDIKLWNCYGPTEATFGMSILCVNGEQVVDGVVPIGLPNSSQIKFHLLEERLYIESPFLSKGYFKNPAQTEKNFPTLNINGKEVRVFDTENRFLLIDNKLIFKGRITADAHCKVSGVKVNPNDIERCLERYNHEMKQNFFQAYVVIKPWLNNDKLFAYLVVHQNFNKTDFMNYIKKWLKKEETPIIIELEHFPRLIPSEKIDRRALIERVDHPDEFFFNEGFKNKKKFSGEGLGLAKEVKEEKEYLIEKVRTDPKALTTEHELFQWIDETVLGANHLDQALNTASSYEETVLKWLSSAFTVLREQVPDYFSLIDTGNEARYEELSVPHLSSLAQLLHYYGKAARYASMPDKEREKILRKSVELADFLEHKSSMEDVHAFRGRLLTYNLSLMLCIRDQGAFEPALDIARQQSNIAREKDEIMLVIQFESYIADILLAKGEKLQALAAIQEALLLAKKFYLKHLVYFNVLSIYIKYYLQYHEHQEACALSVAILDSHQKDPLCGVKRRHLQLAYETLNDHDRLTQIWYSTTGFKNNDQYQEFIFAGGNSFLLHKLFTEIKRDIGPKYTYQKLTSLPALTLAEIRKSLGEKHEVDSNIALARPLFSVDPQQENYFFLPPLLGEGYFTYRELAKVFRAHYPFNIYGLSEISLFDGTKLPISLEESALRYVKKIKQIQPHGPYYLLGFSYGCTLAYYVAQELLAQNESINSLHLVDGFPPMLYQQLSVAAHAELLQELINFVIETLNNKFYEEGLKKIKLKNFDSYRKKEFIHLIFDGLIKKVKKESSTLLLALARQHLLLLLDAKQPAKLPVWVNLYLSTPNQTYLGIIDRINKLVKKSVDYRSYYWNHYFLEVNRTGKRVDGTHTELLLRQNTQWTNSVHVFWERAHDKLYNLQCDYLALTPFYVVQALDEECSSCHIYSLYWGQVPLYKHELASHPSIMNVYAYPLYQSTARKTERNDDLFTTKYALSFLIKNKDLDQLPQLLGEGIKHYIPDNSAASKKKKAFLEMWNQIENEPSRDFCLNLDIFWNGSYLMSLYFKCYGDFKAVLRTLYYEADFEIDKLSDIDNDMYNFSHLMLYTKTSSIFDAFREASRFVNQFMSLVIPPVKEYYMKPSSPKSYNEALFAPMP